MDGIGTSDIVNTLQGDEVYDLSPVRNDCQAGWAWQSAWRWLGANPIRHTGA